MDEKLTGTYLIDNIALLHLSEKKEGFEYYCFDREEKKYYTGKISWEDINDSPVGNALSAARILATDEIGFIGEKVSEVSMQIKEDFDVIIRNIKRRQMKDSEFDVF